jgi:hypothetical protein
MNCLVRLLAGMVVVLGLAGGPQRSGAQTPDARAELEEFADKLKFFPPHGVAANQPDTRDLPGDLRETYRKFLARIAQRKYEVKSLVDLLQHKNPRVRTLALAALFAREDPQLLPPIAALVTDKAETFPAPRADRGARVWSESRAAVAKTDGRRDRPQPSAGLPGPRRFARLRRLLGQAQGPDLLRRLVRRATLPGGRRHVADPQGPPRGRPGGSAADRPVAQSRPGLDAALAERSTGHGRRAKGTFIFFGMRKR